MSKEYILLACADIHYTDKKPICRVDTDFMETQNNKLSQISDLASAFFLPIVVAGDLADYWNIKGWHILHNVVTYLNSERGVQCCFGQHDLPDNDHTQYRKSLANVLNTFTGGASCLSKYEIQFCSWNQPPTKLKTNKPAILVCHKMVWNNSEPFPGASGHVKKVLENKLYNQFDVVISGDNHKRFVVRYNDTLWINCGCVFRTKTNEQQLVPCVNMLYWDTIKKKFGVAKHVLDYEVSNVSSDHMEVSKVEDNIDFSFINNISLVCHKKQSFKKQILSSSKVLNKPVRNKVLEFIREK